MRPIRPINSALVSFGTFLAGRLAKLTPQSLSVVVLGLVLTFVSTVFTVMAYYKDADNPRNILASRGIPWSQERMFEAIRTGDVETVSLFLKGDMKPHAYADDRQLSIHLSSNHTNPEEVLQQLLAHGLDVNYDFPVQRTTGPQQHRLLFWAVQRSNEPLVKALLTAGARSDFETTLRIDGPATDRRWSLIRLAEERAAAPNAPAEASRILAILRGGS